MKKQWTAMVLFSLIGSLAAHAEVATEEVVYKQGEAELQGFFAWDDAAKTPRPGVLVVHEWWGHNEHARNQAKRLAEAGYVGFALDMYGRGKVATHPADAQKFMAEAMSDPQALADRFMAALELLKANEHVDADRIAAIGYCFGGGVVLNMARQGVDLDAVATFHGSLATAQRAQPGQVKARILVLNGADDPLAPQQQIDALKEEMKNAGAKLDFVNLEGARHSFTNPDADKAGMEALAYNAEADKKSWQLLLEMLSEVFGSE